MNLSVSISRIRTRRPRGFSFTEILFAVMILGIGFIMIAAMFPVAIRQTEANNSETISASVGRQAYSYFNQVAANQVGWQPPAQPMVTTSVLVPTIDKATYAGLYPTGTTKIPAGQTSYVYPGQVWSFLDGRDTYNATVGTTPPVTKPHATYLWNLISKNQVQATDPRFAYVAFYKRDLVAYGASGATVTPAPAPYATVIMVCVQSRRTQQYDPVNDADPAKTTLLPTYVSNATISAGAGGSPTIKFNGVIPGQVGENTYVIVNEDYGTGAAHGRVYRIGVVDSTVAKNARWFFAPGEGPGLNDPAIAMCDVFLVGKAPDQNTPGSFAGNAQDVSVFTTLVQTN